MTNEPKENKEKILTKGSNMATTANTHYSYFEEKESGRDKLKIKTNNFLKLKWSGGILKGPRGFKAQYEQLIFFLIIQLLSAQFIS